MGLTPGLCARTCVHHNTMCGLRHIRHTCNRHGAGTTKLPVASNHSWCLHTRGVYTQKRYRAFNHLWHLHIPARQEKERYKFMWHASGRVACFSHCHAELPPLILRPRLITKRQHQSILNSFTLFASAEQCGK